ncbi:MAG: HAD-IIIC family phosphatase [bacterium]
MVVISSTFTAEPIKKSLIFFLKKIDFLKKHKFELTSYNQVFHEVENHHSVTAKNIDGINVFMIKLDDFLRFQKKKLTKHEVAHIIQREMSRFSKSLAHMAQSISAASFIVVICHSIDSATQEIGANIVNNFINELAGISNVHFINETDIMQALKIDNYFDSIADDNGHIPFILEYYNVLGYLLARKIFSINLLSYKPLKAIILDCDNTLWKGICGEIGSENVEVTPPYQFLQHFMKEQKERGVLICLCSKNNEKDVFDVFSCKKSDMLLKLEDIVAYKINWNLKSDNIRELLDFLGFSEQNVVFMDDREDECLEVQKNFPNLLTVQLPDEKNIQSFLTNIWVFDHIKKTTKEDKNRTSIYQKKFNLKGIDKSDNGLSSNKYSHDALVDLIELNSDNIRPDIIQRVADLTSRTNQFNLKKNIYSESQILSFIEKKSFTILLADVKDASNNEYGLTGLAIFSIHDNALLIKQLFFCKYV